MATRQFAERDIPQVVDLYWNYMRRRKGSAPPQLPPLFRELYFANPFADDSSPSFVFEDKSGRILGFLGVSGRRFSVNGRPIRAAYGGNFVVHPEARGGLAAPRLLGALMASNHDLVMTDSANEVTRSVLERLDFYTVPAQNVHWARPLRPAQYLAHAVSRAVPIFGAGLQLAAKPFCIVADAALRNRDPRLRQSKSRLQGAELDVAALAQCQIAFRNGYSLWPEYDVPSLHWLLSFMGQRRKRGQLRLLAVQDGERTVGWYIYYVKRGAVGEVVQVGGDPKFFREILRHLFHDAWEQGVIALHGVADFRQLANYSDEGCFFTCRGGWMLARARDPQLLSILDRGDGFLSRLDGEWCLDPGE